MVCLPAAQGRFPTLVLRSPYVDDMREASDADTLARCRNDYAHWLRNGYAVVFQHCRGSGKSSGDRIPYINKREDGLFLQQWIREQLFYDGSLYLYGSSYTASVHYVTAPFAPDIKGAVLNVQDCERYNCNYRNGFYKIGLHGSWHVSMYRTGRLPRRSYTEERFLTLPLSSFSETVFGAPAPDLDAILRHPEKNDPFWLTRWGGGEAHDAIRDADIPILLITGFYDIYTGGIFDMWNGLTERTRNKSALLVHPYDHGNDVSGQPVRFPDAEVDETFGDYVVRWMNAVRGKNAFPFRQGEVTYYQLFGNCWRTDRFLPTEKQICLSLGTGERTYLYDPSAPAVFKGGLSTNFGGSAWQDPPDSRQDILSFILPAFPEDTFIKGKITARLRVRSDCADTCFYMRLSLIKAEGAYGLRDDINQISNFCADYVPGQEIDMDFSFDEHAFLIKKGEKLRVDISSSAFPFYVPHTNNKGLYSLQKTAKTAVNSVICGSSFLCLPVECPPQ